MGTFIFPYKKGGGAKIPITCKLNFSVCKHYLRPYPSSPSFGALAGQWCVLTTSGQQTWQPQCLYIRWVTQEAPTPCITTTSHKEISKVVWYIFFLACAAAFLTTVPWLRHLKTNWVSLQAAMAGRHCPSHHCCSWDYIRHRGDLQSRTAVLLPVLSAFPFQSHLVQPCSMGIHEGPALFRHVPGEHLLFGFHHEEASMLQGHPAAQHQPLLANDCDLNIKANKGTA